jgi:hypothetical protein
MREIDFLLACEIVKNLLRSLVISVLRTITSVYVLLRHRRRQV